VLRFRSSAEPFLPHAVAATLAVVVLPVLAVSFIDTAGRPWLLLSSVLLAMLLSVAAATLGSAFWTRQSNSTDLVFGDLMLWGLLRRVRAERRLAQAQGLLGSGAAEPNAHVPSLERRRKILQRLAAMLEAKDAYTLGHSRRVSRHAERIAREMGLSREDVARIRIAASVHDVGKVHTPRQILTKACSLTAQELEVMQRHPVDGAQMVAEMGDPEITAMVRYHHERLDGTGYPDGLRGNEIPLGARIISVADTFDAITSARVYQGARKHRRALDVVSEEAGSRLDPDAVAAFLRYYSGRRAVAWSAFGLTGPPRLLTWIGGLFNGVGGIASPLAQGLAAIVAATLAGASLGGQPAPATAASRQTPTTAHGSASDGAARADSAPAAGRRTEPAPRKRLAPIVDRPKNRRAPDAPGVDSPGAPGSGGGTDGTAPVDTAPGPSVQLPSVDLPAVKLPAVKLPEPAPLELRVPQLKVPELKLPTLQVPTIEAPRQVPLSQVLPGAKAPL
jgi:putative nucleotidyltransferase with HDIG domain